MNKKKIMSLIMALVMLVGVFSPLTALAAGETKLEQTTKKVTVHKLIPADKTTSAQDIKSQIEALAGDKKYTGQKLNLAADVNKAKEIKDVYFIWTNDKDQVIDESGNTIKKDKKEITITNNKLPEGIKESDLTTKLAGLTTSNGKEFDTSKLPAGKYKIYEIHSLSKYKGDNGETLTGMLAVPVELTLPLNDVVEAHVYPKNTEDKPKIDKNFDSEKNGEAAGITKDDLTDATKDKDLNINLDDNTRDKGTAKKQLGDKVPYKVVTEIPAQTKWATAKWDDKMTEGLTYNNGSLTIELKKGQDTVALTKDTHYTLKEDKNGFVLNFTKDGLEKINNQTEKQTITLKYTATLNEKAVADVEESNDITFHYGNNPGHGNTPIPTKPNPNGELEVEKTWADGVPKAGEWATFTLKNAKTGKEIGTVKFETTANGTTTTYTQAAGYQAIGNEKPQGPTTKTDKNNVWTFKFTGLDKDLEYKVEEDNNMNETAKFTKGTDGQIKIENKKDHNPTPLNPSEPKVVTGGKKFVKTNNEEKNSEKLERLSGAEFLVKKSENEYLAYKSQATSTEDKKALETAKNAYEDAVQAWNKAVEDNPNTADEQIQVTIGGETITGKKAAEDKIATLLEKYKAALKTDGNAYEWVADKKAPNVVKLISNADGQFEIKGLAYGTYTLEEIKAPAGYALPTGGGNFTFEVKKGSYKGEDTEIQYNREDTNKGYGQQVKNSNVTIPQTGGMGTVLFTIVGISLMAGAVVAMKRNREEA